MSDLIKQQQQHQLTHQQRRNELHNPATIDDLWRVAKMVAASGLAPQGINTPEAVAVVMMHGSELGLSVMQSLQQIHVIKGKVSLSADLQVSLVRQHPACEYFKIVEWTDSLCTYETKRKDGDPVRFTFTLDDAKRAGLFSSGGNWSKYPKHMLRARAASSLARAEYPDAINGLYTPDEVKEIDMGEAVVTSEARSEPTRQPKPHGSAQDRFGVVEEEVIDATIEEDQGLLV